MFDNIRERDVVWWRKRFVEALEGA
jgi:hypothetical protein